MAPGPHHRTGRRRPASPAWGAVLATASAGAVLLALTGCSGEDADASVRAAQLSVTAKEKDLAQAQDAASAAAAKFCPSSTT
jgi:hypothetical protein